MANNLRHAVETEGDEVADLHLWRLGPGHMSAIISIITLQAREADYYRARLARFRSVSHLTVEILRKSRIRGPRHGLLLLPDRPVRRRGGSRATGRPGDGRTQIVPLLPRQAVHRGDALQHLCEGSWSRSCNQFVDISKLQLLLVYIRPCS